MKTTFLAVGLFGFMVIGCNRGDENKQMKTTAFTEKDACKALAEVIRLPPDSPLGKAVASEKCTRSNDPEIWEIEANEDGRIWFSLKQMEFTIVRGWDGKNNKPYEVHGQFYKSDSGKLKAKFVGQH